MNEATRSFMLRNALADLADSASNARIAVRHHLDNGREVMWNYFHAIDCDLAKAKALMPPRPQNGKRGAR